MNNYSSTNNLQSEPLSRNELHQQRRDQRREARAGGLGWVAGFLLILLGGAFLLQNQGLYTFPFTNWWALFILIPALGSFDQAIQHYRYNGNRLEQSACGALLMGIILSMVAFAFLFNLNWAVVGPLLIIFAGAGILLNAGLIGKQ